MLDISIIKCLSDNYSYLIRDKKTNLVGVVDPSEFSPVDLEISKNYKKLDFILNTHHHNDHVDGNLDLKKKYNSKIICSTYDEKRIPGADIKKNDGDNFSLGETVFDEGVFWAGDMNYDDILNILDVIRTLNFILG